jgi:hypothetical protein
VNHDVASVGIGSPIEVQGSNSTVERAVSGLANGLIHATALILLRSLSERYSYRSACVGAIRAALRAGTLIPIFRNSARVGHEKGPFLELGYQE